MKKRHIYILTVAFLVLIAAILAACSHTPDTTISEPESTLSDSSSSTPSTTISIPEISKPESIAASSSPASSSTPDLTVEGPSSAPTSSAPVSSEVPEPITPIQKPSNETAASVPDTVSEPEPPESEVSSEIRTEIPPAVGPRGTHGETCISSDGETLYYHAGADMWLEAGWFDNYGNFPELTRKIEFYEGREYWSLDTSTLKDGTRQITPFEHEDLVWCSADCTIAPENHRGFWHTYELHVLDHPNYK